MARDRLAARLVGWAVDRGVDFTRADPADRDWMLYLSLAVRHLDTKAAAAVQLEAASRMLDLSTVMLQRAHSSAGMTQALQAWQASFEALLHAVAGTPEDERKRSDGAARSDIIETYRRAGGDMADPTFAEQARLAAEWVEAGNKGVST